MVPDQRQHNQGGSTDLLTLTFFDHQVLLGIVYVFQC
jgi:hypothetical protein